MSAALARCAEYVRLARLNGYEVNADPAELDYIGVGVRTQANGLHVWVVKMLVNWRIIECDERQVYRFWCYPGLGTPTFLLAVRHADLYHDGEPDGWIKSWDGRRNDLPAGFPREP